MIRDDKGSFKHTNTKKTPRRVMTRRVFLNPCHRRWSPGLKSSAGESSLSPIGTITLAPSTTEPRNLNRQRRTPLFRERKTTVSPAGRNPCIRGGIDGVGILSPVYPRRKELQRIVDFTRSRGSMNIPAIDPVFAPPLPQALLISLFHCSYTVYIVIDIFN